MSYYQHRITELAPGYDPAEVEDVMRLRHRTLDALTPATFKTEVRLACRCLDAEVNQTPRRLTMTTTTTTRTPKPGSKGHQLIQMIKRPKGASLDEIVKAMNIKPHSARAQISVYSRGLDLKVVCEGGRYSIAR